MNKYLTVLLISILVAGCGGGDGREEAELTGTLQGGHIQGVAWRTPTRSGTTDADGHFAYLPGETVTFSLGPVELGSAPGSTDITLFTLAGLTPPTTERALRRELDLAMRTQTPFTRAIALDLLLIALDADGDPDNGIDVRNRADVLAGVTLDFDARLSEMGIELYSKVPSLIQSVPLFKPVAHLYASLGLRVPVHAPTRALTDSSVSPAIGVDTFAYYANGQLHSVEQDRDGDGVLDSREAHVYDAFGRQTSSQLTFDNDLDHVTDQDYSTTYEFDARGKITAFEQRSADTFPGGSRATYRLVENEVDAFGRPVRQVVDLDWDSDGTVDSRETTITHHDGQYGGTLTRTTDSNVDGIADSGIAVTEVRDAQRRLLSRVTEWDDDANGVVDASSTDTAEYDDVARTARMVSDNDADADGTPDLRTVTTWRFDRAGNVVAQSSSYEPFADGVAWQTQSIAREFDAARRVTGMTRDEDWDGDGLPESRQAQATTYDDLGNVTWATSDFDLGVDGRIDGHSDEGSEYGAAGELLASASHLDLDGDGFTDIRTGLTMENTLIEDGVTLLTSWYFRTRFSGYD
jgi:hypothetical protein